MVPAWLNDLKNTVYEDMGARTFVRKLQSWRTHVDNHMSQTTVDMLDRGFAKCPSDFAISTFDDPATMTTRIEECFTEILEGQPDFVRKTLAADPMEVGSTQTCVALDEQYEDLFSTLSKGVAIDARGRIREYETNVTSVVLRPDEHAPYGFTLVTMFPQVAPVASASLAHLASKPVCRPTDRDLTDEVKQTHFYRVSDPTRQAQLRLACAEFPECLASLRYAPGRDGQPPSVSASFRAQGNKRYLVYVDEFGTTLREKHRDTHGTWRNAPCELADPPAVKVDLSSARARRMLAHEAPDVEAYVSRMEAEMCGRQHQHEKTRHAGRRLPNPSLMGYDEAHNKNCEMCSGYD